MLIKDGWAVTIVGRDRDKLDDALERLSSDAGAVSGVAANLADDVAATVVAQHLACYDNLDLLVNNAGIGSAGAAEEHSIEQDQQVFDINVFGVIRMTRAVLPHMRARGAGRVINISSVLGFVPAPYRAVYAASKHAVEGYSESLDHEVREYGVRVLLVEPGITRTGFEGNVVEPEAPLHAYAAQRQVADDVVTALSKYADDPAAVAKTIVAAATDSTPKLRYPAGSTAGLIRTLRRVVPARAFDWQLRKLNRLAG